MKGEVREHNAPSRELAQRLSGADEVLLLRRPEIDRVELSVRDELTGAGFDIEVAPGNAIDAFHHPYAYAAARGASCRIDRAETTRARRPRRKGARAGRSNGANRTAFKPLRRPSSLACCSLETQSMVSRFRNRDQPSR